MMRKWPLLWRGASSTSQTINLPARRSIGKSWNASNSASPAHPFSHPLWCSVSLPEPLSVPCAQNLPAPSQPRVLTDGSPRQRAEEGWGRVLRINLVLWIASHSLPCTAAIRSVLEWQPVGHPRHSGWPHCSPKTPVGTTQAHRLFGTIVAKIPLQGPQPIALCSPPKH